MGSVLDLKADEPTSEIIRDLKDVETARQALIKDRTTAKARLSVATLKLFKKQAALHLQQMERDITKVDTAIEMKIQVDEMLSRKADFLFWYPRLRKGCVIC
jgi:transposase